ncbi:MAG: beta-N-acetylhexosaminidase [Bacteroidota bacterium]|nr:beta-N-acetylhexosaminidase [Bacteroidota bacterium]
MNRIQIKMFLASLLFVVTALGSSNTAVLMPYPSSIQFTSEQFRVNESFTVNISGQSSPRLHKAVVRIFDRIAGRTGLFLSTDYKSNRTVSTAQFIVSISRTGILKVGEDETYSLSVTKDSVLLYAATDLGAMHGLETLMQLLGADSFGYFFTGCSVNDKPRFAWRGLMIDVARHYMPLDVIFRNIDGMAAVKLNVLHLHLSENQGFRVECKTYPKLHEMGSDGFYYTHEQIREIIMYANDRGIRVVPEFDMPAHSTSWFVGYPELASAPGPYTIERSWGVFNPVMDPTKESTYGFLDNVFKEMTALFNDEYFHIGGDENTGKDWDSSVEISRFKKEKKITSNHALQNYFIKRVSELLTKYNKKIIGWEEILQEGTLKSTVLQTWREDKSLINALKKGYQVLVSRGYYIDLMYSAENHYTNDPFPADEVLSVPQQELILGGETTMWSEFVTPENVDSRIWPRVAAIAERFWSPREIRNVDDMYRRMGVISFQLEELGLLHKKNQMMMLRRLVSNGDYRIVQHLLDVAEPLEEYNRFDKGKEFTSYSSYSRFMDVAVSDAPLKRIVASLVNRHINNNDSSAHDSLSMFFALWKMNHVQFTTVQQTAPILREVETLSADLAFVGALGEECLKIISSKETMSFKEFERMSEQLTKASLQRGQCELVIIESMKRLLNFAAQQ